MANHLRQVEVLSGLFDDKSPKINLQHLAKFFNVNDKDIAEALSMSASSLSRNPLATPDKMVHTWLSIFNLLIQVIDQNEPDLLADQVKQKMQLWLNLPRPELEDSTPLAFMLKGKSRKVKFLLEQVLG
jgi:hypothetical protein